MADSSSIEVSDLIALSNWVIERVRKLVPISGNLEEEGNFYRFVSSPVLHRDIGMKLLRKRPDSPNTKAFFEEVRSLNLDYKASQLLFPYETASFYLATLNGNFTLSQILTLLSNYPKQSDKNRSPIRALESAAVRAIKQGIGNCGEVTAIAFFLFAEYPKEGLEGLPKITKAVNLERIEFLPPYDHVYIVLNRDTNTKIDDPSSWNDDVVICEPWLGKTFTKAEFLDFMQKNNILTKEKYQSSTLSQPSRSQQYYIGETFNSDIHSAKWKNSHDGSKSYRPLRVIDVKERPHTPANKNLQLIINKFNLSYDGKVSFRSIKPLYEISSTFNLPNLNRLLKKLAQMQTEHHETLCLRLSSLSDIVDVHYDANLKKWIMIKSDRKIYYADNEHVLTDRLKDAFADKQDPDLKLADVITMSTKFYAEPESEQNSSQSFMNTFIQNPEVNHIINGLVANYERVDFENNNRLHIAAYEGYAIEVKSCLMSGIILPNQLNKKGLSPLHLAILREQNDIVKLLAEDSRIDLNLPLTNPGALYFNGSKMLEKNAFVKTPPLHLAILLENERIVEILINYGALLNELDGLGRTSLLLAQQSNKPNILGLLSAKNISHDTPCTDGTLPICVAIQLNNQDLLKQYLEKGANPKLIQSDGETPVTLAAKMNNLNALIMLQAYGVDLRQKNGNGRSAMDIALENNNIKLINFLMQYGAEIETPPTIEHLISLIIYNENEIFALYILFFPNLLKTVIEVDKKDLLNFFHNRPDSQMIHSKLAALIQNQNGSIMLNLLHLAIFFGYFEITKALIQNNFNLNESFAGLSVFDLAGVFQRVEIEKALYMEERKRNLELRGEEDLSNPSMLYNLITYYQTLYEEICNKLPSNDESVDKMILSIKQIYKLYAQGGTEDEIKAIMKTNTQQIYNARSTARQKFGLFSTKDQEKEIDTNFEEILRRINDSKFMT